jgi:hypothetical protein
MAGKYALLGDHLRACAAEGRSQVDLSFATIDRLVNGLPASARQWRPWWANSGRAQGKAWLDAGWAVHSVDLHARQVVFVKGAGAGRAAPVGTERSAIQLRASDPAARRTIASAELPVLECVVATVRFTWRDAGELTVDGGGKVAFPLLPEPPGLYRLTLTGDPNGSRPRVYIGESDGLRRRASGYRNPAPTQLTNVRVNALLRAHIGLGGVARMAVSSEVELVLPAEGTLPLDLTRKAGRLLAESAALVLAQITNDADIDNIG